MADDIIEEKFLILLKAPAPDATQSLAGVHGDFHTAPSSHTTVTSTSPVVSADALGRIRTSTALPYAQHERLFVAIAKLDGELLDYRSH